MKRPQFLLLGLSLACLLSGCLNPFGDTGSDTVENGYTVSVVITNLPGNLVGHQVLIDVSQKMNDFAWVTTGAINSFISGSADSPYFDQLIRTYKAGTGIGFNAKQYSGSVTLSFDIYIDVDGDGEMKTVGTDIADGVNFANLTFTQAGVQTIDYTKLHISGG
jgi:hypothetical protein